MEIRNIQDIKTKANYEFATKMAYKFLIAEGITSFPIDVFALVKKHKWAIITFNELAQQLGISYELLKESLGDCWGTVHFNGINYAIAYDDDLCKGAQYFTILHEIGHILMGHLTSKGCIKVHSNDIELGNENEYEKMENEANCFARNVAAPISLLDELEFGIDEEYLAAHFCITPKAAKSRLDLVKSDRYYLKSVDKNKLLHNCSDFLSSLLDLTFSDVFQEQQNIFKELSNLFNYS